MKTKLNYTYWQDDDWWLGYFNEYPSYMTQGKTLLELKENLLDVYKELTNGNIPSVRKISELVVA